MIDVFFYIGYLILFVKLIGYLLKKIGKTFYNISFNEGIEHNTMEVYASEHVQVLENSENLKNKESDRIIEMQKIISQFLVHSICFQRPTRRPHCKMVHDSLLPISHFMLQPVFRTLEQEQHAE